MEKGRKGLSPFMVVSLVAVFATLYIFVNLYMMQGFATFTAEEEIESAIETEFPLFVDYL